MNQLNQQVSAHFTLAEATVTQQNLDNSPDNDEDLATIQRTAMRMEVVRDLLGDRPIVINSWYRSTAVNKAVGGVSDSQHKLGEAVDFTCKEFGTPIEICRFLVLHIPDLDFDQLILEPTWVHISFNTSRLHRNKANRNQLLTLTSPGHYATGILDLHK